MQRINLSQNQIAIVDDRDFAEVSKFRWCHRPERNGAQGYAVRHIKVDGKDRLSYLHRELMNPPPGHEVIFLNYDRLDCRRENLRVVTKQDARRHHRVRSDSRSGVKGVHYNPEYETWSACTYRHGHYYGLGTFYSREAAMAAYEDELRRENPDLHQAPATIDRSELPQTNVQEPDQGQPNVQPCCG
jgi:HNH endonuclease